MAIVGQESVHHAEVNHPMRQPTTWSSVSFHAQFSMGSSATKKVLTKPHLPCVPTLQVVPSFAAAASLPTSRRMSTSTNAQPCHGRIGYKAGLGSRCHLERPLDWNDHWIETCCKIWFHGRKIIEAAPRAIRRREVQKCAGVRIKPRTLRCGLKTNYINDPFW